MDVAWESSIDWLKHVETGEKKRCKEQRCLLMSTPMCSSMPWFHEVYPFAMQSLLRFCWHIWVSQLSSSVDTATMTGSWSDLCRNLSSANRKPPGHGESVLGKVVRKSGVPKDHKGYTSAECLRWGCLILLYFTSSVKKVLWTWS